MNGEKMRLIKRIRIMKLWVNSQQEAYDFFMRDFTFETVRIIVIGGIKNKEFQNTSR